MQREGVNPLSSAPLTPPLTPGQKRSIIKGKMKESNIYISGQIGKQLIYYTRGTRIISRPYKIPFDPQSLAQLAHRANFQAASNQWNFLSAAEKKEWNDQAAITYPPLTGYNLFIRFSLTGRI